MKQTPLIYQLIRWIDQQQTNDAMVSKITKIITKRRNGENIEILCQLANSSPLWSYWISFRAIQQHQPQLVDQVLYLDFTPLDQIYDLFQPISIFGVHDGSKFLLNMQLPKQLKSLQNSVTDSRFQDSLLREEVDSLESQLQLLVSQQLPGENVYNLSFLCFWGTYLTIEKANYIQNNVEVLRSFFERQKSHNADFDIRNFKNIIDVEHDFQSQFQEPKDRMDRFLCHFISRYVHCPIVCQQQNQFYNKTILDKLGCLPNSPKRKSCFLTLDQLMSQSAQMKHLASNMILPKSQSATFFAELSSSLLRLNPLAKILFIGRSDDDYIREINQRLKQKQLSMDQRGKTLNFNFSLSVVGACKTIDEINRNSSLGNLVYVKGCDLQNATVQLQDKQFTFMLVDVFDNDIMLVPNQLSQLNVQLNIYFLTRLPQNQIENDNLLFCLSGEKEMNPQYLCYFEFNYLSRLLFNSLDNIIQNQKSLVQLQTKITSHDQQNVNILQYNLSFSDEVRVRSFIEADPSFSRLLNDDRRSQLSNIRKQLNSVKMSPQLYQLISNYHLAHLLKNIWLEQKSFPTFDIDEQTEQLYNSSDLVISDHRQLLIDMYFVSLEYKTKSVMIVVPDLIIPIMKDYLKNKNCEVFDKLHDFQIKLFNTGKLNVFLMKESLIYVYLYMTENKLIRILKDLLPQIVLFPFLSTRPTELLVDQLYRSLGVIQPPTINIIVAVKTVEEQLLIYRQKFSHLHYQEYVNFSNHLKRQNKTSHCGLDNILEQINQFGFDLGCTLTKPFIQDPQADVQTNQLFIRYGCDQFTRLTLCNYLHSDAVIQAATNDTFRVSPSMSNHVIVSTTFGSQIDSFNVNSDNQLYNYPGMVRVSLVKDLESTDITIKSGSYYIYNLNPNQITINLNDQPKLMINQCLLSHSSLSQNLTNIDMLTKFLPKQQDADSPFETIKNYMLYAKGINVNDVQSYVIQEKRKGQSQISKNYLSLPIFNIWPNDNRNLYTSFIQQPQLEQKITICNLCSSKDILWSAKCDLCSQSTVESPDYKSFNVQKTQLLDNSGAHIFDLQEIIGTKNSKTQNVIVDFIQNYKLNLLAYNGASRHDPLIVQPLKTNFDEDIIQSVLAIIFKENFPTTISQVVLNSIKLQLAAAFSLINENRFFAPSTFVQKYQFQKHLQANGQVWLQSVMNYIMEDQLGITNHCTEINLMRSLCQQRILYYLCPYECFGFLRLYDKVPVYKNQFINMSIRDISYQILQKQLQDTIINGNSHVLKQYGNLEFYDFSLRYYEFIGAKRLSDRYLPHQQSNFMSTLISVILCDNENKQLQYVDRKERFWSDFLQSTSVFNTKNVVNDSYLILGLVTNILNKDHDIPFILTQSGITSVDVNNIISLPNIHRYYRYSVRNISFVNQLSKYYETPEVDQLIQFIGSKQYDFTKKYDAIQILFSLPWDPMVVSLGQNYLDYSVQQLIQNSVNTMPVHRFLLLNGVNSQKKIPDSTIIIKDDILKVPERAKDEITVQPYATSRMQPTIYNQSYHQQQQFNQRQQQQQLYNTRNSDQMRAVQYSQTQQYQQFQQNLLNQQQHHPVLPVSTSRTKYDTKPHSAQHHTQPLMVNQNFVDRVLAEAKLGGFSQNLLTKRLLEHYNIKSYYCKTNLLYIPSVVILTGEDTFRQSCGLKIQSGCFTRLPESDNLAIQETYRILLQSICYDYNVQGQNSEYQQQQQYKYQCIKILQSTQQMLKSSQPIQSQFVQNNELDKWVYRRTLLQQFQDREMVVFKDDPVVGCENSQNDFLNGSQNVFTRYGKWCDNFKNISPDEARAEVESLAQFCRSQLPEEQIKKLIHIFVKLGFSIGSTPSDVFTNHIKALENSNVRQYQQFAVLTSIMRMILLCNYFTIMPFPFEVEKMTQNPTELKRTMQRLEHMRLINMKVSQFEYVQFLHRISPKSIQGQPVKKDIQHQIVDDFLKQMVSSDVTVFNPEYKKMASQQCPDMMDKLDILITTATSYDQQNKQMWIIENQFIEFIGKKRDSAQDLRLLFLSHFSINDYDRYNIRNTWKIAAAFKFMFIQLFTGETSPNGSSQSIRTFQQLIDSQIINEQEKQYVQELHSEISNIWSRLQDYLFLRLIIDLGFTEMLMSAVIGSQKIPDLRQQAKVEVLNKSILIENPKLLQTSPLWHRFSKLQNAVDIDNNNYTWIYQLLEASVKVIQTKDSISQTIKTLMSVCPNAKDALLGGQNNQQNDKAIQNRAENLAKALRVERILQVDPLQINIKDNAIVDLFNRPAQQRQSLNTQYAMTTPNLPLPVQHSYNNASAMNTSQHQQSRHSYLGIQQPNFIQPPGYVPLQPQYGAYTQFPPQNQQQGFPLINTQASYQHQSYQDMNSSTINPNLSLQEHKIPTQEPNSTRRGRGHSNLGNQYQSHNQEQKQQNPQVQIQYQNAQNVLPPPAHNRQQQPMQTERKTTRRPREPPQPQQNQQQQSQLMPQIQLSDVVSKRIAEQQLSFYLQPQKIIEQFIHDIIEQAKCVDQFNKTSIDQFLFVQSSCQRTNSESWGRLYSFYINNEPVPLEVSEKLAKDSKQQLITQGSRMYPNLANDDSKLFEQLLNEIFSPDVTDQKQQLNQEAQRFVEAHLNIAYYHAYYMRKEIIENQSNSQTRRGAIHVALRSMQFMRQIPLNLIIQNDRPENKRKMALATYFFLCSGQEAARIGLH